MIRSQSDCVVLQTELANIAEWCVRNSMCLNLSKCKAMTFSRLSNIFVNEYSVAGHELERVEVIRDLGVLFDSKLTFVRHMSVN